jgi:NADH:ubiquinone oxidoreductase subunit 3 (subunit A)
MTFLLAPPVAFLIYFVLVALLSGLGRMLAARGEASPLKTTTYAAGEAAPRTVAAPGYRPFFVVALYFAILHLGVLILGSSDFSPAGLAYLAGLVLVLLALTLG